MGPIRASRPRAIPAGDLVERQEIIASLGWVDGDITGDGLVTGDGYGDPSSDDVAAFVQNWKAENLVMGYAVGDGVSRAMGDFNYDGIVDLFDWHTLRTNHPGGAGLNLGELLASSGVPEPSAMILLTIGAAIVGFRKFRIL